MPVTPFSSWDTLGRAALLQEQNTFSSFCLCWDVDGVPQRQKITLPRETEQGAAPYQWWGYRKGQDLPTVDSALWWE